jgi:hypothetical protein
MQPQQSTPATDSCAMMGIMLVSSSLASRYIPQDYHVRHDPPWEGASAAEHGCPRSGVLNHRYIPTLLPQCSQT